MPDSAAVIQLPYNSNLLAILADAIIEKHSSSLPDLSHVVVLLSNPACAADMRKYLLKAARGKNYTALLGPNISSLRPWIEENYSCKKKKLSQHGRELILVEALRDHPQLPGARQPWLLAENLLTLFDELNEQHIQLADDESEFNRELRKAYGVELENNNDLLSHLDRESHLIHQLWKAWQAQLEQLDADDALGIYHQKLQLGINDENDAHDYWLVGYHSLQIGEQQWFNSKSKQQQASWYKHSSTIVDETGSLTGKFFSEVYNNSNYNFADRARSITTEVPTSPLQDRLSIAHTDNEDQQACAVELQVRLWLTEGYKRIGIVTQDRRLARRVRALLERANISLQDSAGWALSTTSAAAALERWLECIEQQFEHVALLDLLKSPFIFDGDHSSQYLQTIYRFENDIVLHENIASGMHRYQRALESRRKRLGKLWSEQTFSSVQELLETLQNAARPLYEFKNKQQQEPAVFLHLLFESLEKTGMLSAFKQDLAGQRVIQELEKLQIAIEHHPISMNWSELRSWIGRTLERFSFKPATRDNRVSLVDLKQSQFLQFDAVILAGTDKNHLPGTTKQQAFFNDAVRFSLGLPASDEHMKENFHYFLQLLSSAPKLLITHHLSNNSGEQTILSPWVEALSNFHTLAYGNKLENTELLDMLVETHTAVIRDERVELPPTDCQPRPVSPTNLLPTSISASSYQQLIDCPYKFFAGRLLGLTASDEISEVLSKADYGERVHRCLEAFHGNVDVLPGPFLDQITDNNRQDAEKLLEEIAKSVFASDLEDNFEHRGWLQRFLSLIPLYIEWQIKHNQHWSIHDTESQIQINQPGIDISLKGRLDRIDRNDNGLDIIDYKTGYTPRQVEVDEGEAVQLPFYALLSEQAVNRVEYLSLDQSKVKTAASLEADELQSLVESNQHRLKELIHDLANNAQLPAWGDDTVCGYCDMSGLCRRDNWLDKADSYE